MGCKMGVEERLVYFRVCVYSRLFCAMNERTFWLRILSSNKRGRVNTLPFFTLNGSESPKNYNVIKNIHAYYTCVYKKIKINVMNNLDFFTKSFLSC